MNHSETKENVVHKKTEEQLCLRAKVFENSNEGIIITIRDGTITDVNPAFTKITGYSKKEVVGKKPGMLKSDRHDREFYKNMWRSLFTKGEWEAEIWDRRKSGEVYPKWLSISAVKNSSGEITHFVGIFSDIASVKQSEEQLEQLLHYDFLTGLPNRILFYERLRQAVSYAGRNKQIVGLIFLDMDRLKLVNNALGHRAGDQLLVQTAQRIRDCVSRKDTASRIGGDEFAIILASIEKVIQVARTAGKIVEAISTSFMLGGQEVFVTPSIGIALFPNDGEDSETLIKNADTAMNYAKGQGKNDLQFYSGELYARASERLALETDLRKALLENKLFLHYQPKVDLKTGKIAGAEALIRWSDPDRGFIPPVRFIPLAEETGLIFPIFDVVLDKIGRITPKIQEISGADVPFRIAVNLSALQFKDHDLIEKFENAISRCGVARCLEVELTESMIMSDTDEVISVLNILKEMGINASVDDFGTGYSSLSYLKRLPIDTLKIDRSFIKDIPWDADDMAIVKAIITLGHVLSMKIIAEGVETLEQIEFLRNENCDEVQGFYFYRPLPEDEFLAVLQKETRHS